MVSLTLKFEGNLGAPMNLPSGTETIIPVQTTQGSGTVQVIDLRHQFTAKLSAYYSRQSKNDYDDINFLFASYTTAIYDFSHQLDLQHRQYFAEVYAYNNPSQPGWMTYVRQILRL